jgi:hypothetical protein
LEAIEGALMRTDGGAFAGFSGQLRVNTSEPNDCSPEHVALGAQEAVHLAAVDLGPPAVPRVVGVEEPAALVVVDQAVGRKRVSVGVGEAQAGLAPVGSRQPAQVVVERAVLHHQHDERVDREVPRRGNHGAPLL